MCARDPRLVTLLCYSDACDCLREHIDRHRARMSKEGPTDYLVDELLRTDRLEAEDYGDDSRTAIIARAWNCCPAWVRRALVIQYLAPDTVVIPVHVVADAHAVWRQSVYAVGARALRDRMGRLVAVEQRSE